MEEGKGFGGVGEWDWSFSRRVECCEQKDEKRDEAQVSRTAAGYVKRKSCREQGPRHMGEGEQK